MSRTAREKHDEAFGRPNERPRAIVMVSKLDHCLVDLIYRVRTGWLAMEIAAVISNHALLKPTVEREGIAFIHQQVDASRKAQAEAVPFSTMERERARGRLPVFLRRPLAPLYRGVEHGFVNLNRSMPR
jgi:formyltetrahydrofolate hydrolase